MTRMIEFEKVARLPAPTDNVAIATRLLEGGMEIEFDGRRLALSHMVLEGHRFAVKPIEEGEHLYSWEMPFGTAVRSIKPGEYVCNPGTLEALEGRTLSFDLPEEANFVDDIPQFEGSGKMHTMAEQVPLLQSEKTFVGFDRGERGVGTRNYIAVIAASSRASGFVRRLASECKVFADDFPNIDGIVPVAHTEGDDEHQLNRELVLRTLAGFIVHPNIGAALVVDAPGASVDNLTLQHFIGKYAYPIQFVKNHFISIDSGFEQCLTDGKSQVAAWLSSVNQMERTSQSISRLNLALQCGGSDAFSGVSGNPLAAWAARAVIQHGGKANLAETDELIGAESYILQRVRDRETADRFLRVRDRFIEIAERHGSSAAGNPSGGNKYRGLYNIYLKSLGAAMKKHPDVRLDYVIDYGEPMKEPGYYFMDSPGNDLESIAGQVASGCNMIYFVTGNGSITNFPFVPTVKIVTTTPRYELLKAEMDVNAGAYLDGMPMDALGEHLTEKTIRIASGEQSAGERAGHAQVQIWRNWRIDAGGSSAPTNGSEVQSGLPHEIKIDLEEDSPEIRVTSSRPQYGLILPTSLCSGQVANMAAERLNAAGLAEQLGLSRFVSLVHTEGCGVSSGSAEDLFIRTMAGYLSHPAIRYAFLLEHGCEKTHNDYFKRYMERNDVAAGRFGWASIQRDGGIDQVLGMVEEWFRAISANPSTGETRAPTDVRLGIVIEESLEAPTVDIIGRVITSVVQQGGIVVTARPTSQDRTSSLHHRLGLDASVAPTLNYGQSPKEPGYHIMSVPSTHTQEAIAGLGAAGVDVILRVSNLSMPASHPFIPVLQVATNEVPNVDLVLADDANITTLSNLVMDTLDGVYLPRSMSLGLAEFQLSRGWRGVSL